MACSEPIALQRAPTSEAYGVRRICRSPVLDRRGVVDGDTAVSTLVDTLRGTRDGKPYEARFRCTTVYVRRDGKWLAIAEVFNKAPAPAKSE